MKAEVLRLQAMLARTQEELREARAVLAAQCPRCGAHMTRLDDPQAPTARGCDRCETVIVA